MTVSSAAGFVGGVLGLVGLLSAALVIVRGNIARGTISLLEENQSALKSRLEIVETENRVLKDRVQALEHTKDELFLQVKSMPAFAQMADAVTQMSGAMTMLHEEMGSLTTRLIEHMLKMEGS